MILTSIQKHANSRENGRNFWPFFYDFMIFFSDFLAKPNNLLEPYFFLSPGHSYLWAGNIGGNFTQIKGKKILGCTSQKIWGHHSFLFCSLFLFWSLYSNILFLFENLYSNNTNIQIFSSVLSSVHNGYYAFWCVLQLVWILSFSTLSVKLCYASL